MSEEQTESNAAATAPQAEPSQPQPRGITRITVQGFKSLRDETSIEIRPLTILAGANSSGKSSIMQPLLLMKQTLEAPYDPGPLKLDGPNVKFTRGEQLFSSGERQAVFGIETDDAASLASIFELTPKAGLNLTKAVYRELPVGNHEQIQIEMRPTMGNDNIRSKNLYILEPMITILMGLRKCYWKISRERCFFAFDLFAAQDNTYLGKFSTHSQRFRENLTSIIHVPSMRGNSERSYLRNGVTQRFPGTFENYVASIIYSWQSSQDGRYEELRYMLEALGLAYSITAHRLNDVELELRVGRLPQRPNKINKQDSVNISDVGFGVSQVLPALVALLVAEPGQLVYIDQPELHLHPDTQAVIARLLSDAARRGVRVVVETHSDILLLAVQTLVAKYTEDKDDGLDSNLVALHWFSRDDDGVTHVESANLDANGAFGDWSEDFGRIRVQQMVEYLTYSNGVADKQALANRTKANGRTRSRKNGKNGHSEARPELEIVAADVEASS